MFDGNTNAAMVRFGKEHHGLSAAGLVHAPAASLTDLVQSNPTLAALQIPKVTHNSQVSALEAFSHGRGLGQPAPSVLFDHIKALAAMGHLNADQAHYLAANKHHDVTLWSAIAKLSENRISDPSMAITAGVRSSIVHSFPLKEIARYAVTWKKAFPASIKTSTLQSLHRSIFMATGQRQTKGPKPTDITTLERVSMAVFEEVCQFLNERTGGEHETLFQPFMPAKYAPIAIGFGALEGYTYAIDPDHISELLWKAVHLSLRLIVTLATPGMTTPDILDCELMLDDINDELSGIEMLIEEAGIAADDEARINALIDEVDTWMITSFEELQHFQEIRGQQELEQERWALNGTQIALDSLQHLLNELPEATCDRERALTQWCRDTYKSLKAIDTPWHEILNDETHYDTGELANGVVVMLEADIAAYEQAEQIHRGYMEGGETVDIELPWTAAPEKVAQFADSIGRGHALLATLDNIVNGH